MHFSVIETQSGQHARRGIVKVESLRWRLGDNGREGRRTAERLRGSDGDLWTRIGESVFNGGEELEGVLPLLGDLDAFDMKLKDTIVSMSDLFS